MQKINILKILIISLTSILAFTNFTKNGFSKQQVNVESEKIQILVKQLPVSVSNFKIL